MSDTMDKKVNLKDLKKVFWRSFLIECSYNSERMHNLGYIYSLTPVLKKVYKDDREGMSGALQRHVEFYNATPQIEPCIIGIVSALEEQNAQSGNQMGTIVSAVKAGLMGPMSVIGDTLFFTSGFRIIAVSVGAAMCAAGNPLGLLLYFLIFNIPHYIVRYWGVTRGYKLGSNFYRHGHRVRPVEEGDGCGLYRGSDGDRSADGLVRVPDHAAESDLRRFRDQTPGDSGSDPPQHAASGRDAAVLVSDETEEF